MKNKPTIQVQAGQVLRVKKLTASVDGGLAELEGPRGRHLVVLVLGVSDAGVPFDIEPMLGALGYVPESSAVSEDSLLEHLRNVEQETERSSAEHAVVIRAFRSAAGTLLK